jgi:hypothetical protein
LKSQNWKKKNNSNNENQKTNLAKYLGEEELYTFNNKP